MVRLPGVEPGSIAWKAIILTVGLQTLFMKRLMLRTHRSHNRNLALTQSWYWLRLPLQILFPYALIAGFSMFQDYNLWYTVEKWFQCYFYSF
ncbi:hypothetical protein SUGI_0352620 [Cryptomeria japonica]|nr:hypothetical protein SUGI_0352620 [Cryptomeria japonica]